MALNNGWFDEVRGSIAEDGLQERIKDKLITGWFIFRCDFINQLVNTETGFKPANSIRNRFLQFNRLILGNESIFLTVKGGTRLEKHDEFMNSYYDVKYEPENVKFFKGIKDDESGQTKFGETDLGGFGSFSNIYDEKSFSFITLEKITATHLAEFYLIPNLTYMQADAENQDIDLNQYDQRFDDNDIYHITSYKNYYGINGDFIYSQVSFTNIQFNLSGESGQVIEQHVLFGSPGQGYLIPKLIFNEQGAPIDWKINEEYIKDQGVKAIQIEVQGVYLHAGLNIWGIPIDDAHNSLESKRWYPPRRLSRQQFLLPQTENFFKVKSKSNIPLVMNLNLQAIVNFNSWNAAKQDMFTDNLGNYNGILETVRDDVLSTNKNTYLVNENGLSVPSDANLMDNFENFDVRPNVWFKDEVNGIDKLNLKNVYKRDKANYNYKDLFNLMDYATDHINLMPYETGAKITQDLKQMWGFGKFLNFITLGLVSPWRRIYLKSNTEFPTFSQLPVLVDKTFYEFASNSVFVSNQINSNNTRTWYQLDSYPLKTGGPGKIPLDFTQKNESNLMGALMSNQSTSSPLMIMLTDKLNTSYWKDGNKISKQNISSIMLNETNIEGADNNKESFKVDPDSYFIDSGYYGNDVVTDVNGNKYIITNIGFRGLGDGDARVTTYKENPDYVSDQNRYNNQNFQTITQTQASFGNGAITDWNTNINTSFLDDLSDYQDTPFNWPQQFPINKPKLEDIELKINWNANENPRTTVISWGQSGIPTTGENIGFSITKSYFETNYNNQIGLEEKMIFDFASLGYQSWDEVLKSFSNMRIKIDENLSMHIIGTTAYIYHSNTWSSIIIRDKTIEPIYKEINIDFDRDIVFNLVDIKEMMADNQGLRLNKLNQDNFYNFKKDGYYGGIEGVMNNVCFYLRREGLKVYFRIGIRFHMKVNNSTKFNDKEDFILVYTALEKKYDFQFNGWGDSLKSVSEPRNGNITYFTSKNQLGNDTNLTKSAIYDDSKSGNSPIFPIRPELPITIDFTFFANPQD